MPSSCNQYCAGVDIPLTLPFWYKGGGAVTGLESPGPEASLTYLLCSVFRQKHNCSLSGQKADFTIWSKPTGQKMKKNLTQVALSAWSINTKYFLRKWLILPLRFLIIGISSVFALPNTV